MTSSASANDNDGAPALARLHVEWLPQHGLTINGDHHEIYLLALGEHIPIARRPTLASGMPCERSRCEGHDHMSFTTRVCAGRTPDVLRRNRVAD